MSVKLFHLHHDSSVCDWARQMITSRHYLRKMPDPRTSVEILYLEVNGVEGGALVFGRPEATRCADWYGSVDDAAAGRCEVTRWQVLNLARVWLCPHYQAGGASCRPGDVPGFTDRRGVFRSTLATTVLHMAQQMISHAYLTQRPPCFLDEPYRIEWLTSYCDARQHRGTIYREAGWELYRTNAAGIQTWRVRLPALTAAQDREIRRIAERHPRSIAYRAKREQLEMAL